jgi:fluoroacetyl-CoA thioesterase
MREPTVGSSTDRDWTVLEELTADRWGNDGLQVLATPALIYMFENTCNLLVGPLLEEDELSLGIDVRAEHLAPTPVGLDVRVTATLTEHDRNRLFFELEAVDAGGLVGRGRHTRAVISRDRFDTLLSGRAGAGS